MTKITAEHLARSAYVYIRQSTADQLIHNLESQRRQYGSPIGLASSAGPQSRSSTTISAVPAAASAGRASNAYWRRSALDPSVRCSPSRSLAWRAMAEIGIR